MIPLSQCLRDKVNLARKSSMIIFEIILFWGVWGVFGVYLLKVILF